MKVLTVPIKRNDVFDMMRNLKSFVKFYDSSANPGRFIEMTFLLSKDYVIRLSLDRKERKCIYPLQQKLPD